MAKFLFVYRSQAMAAGPEPSPEEMQAMLATWTNWFNSLGNAVVDAGDGLQPSGKTVHPGGVVSDGPFIEAKELVGGFSILQAESYEHAVELAKGCPILLIGGTVEVREMSGH